MDITSITLFALLTAIATGLGALPLALIRDWPRKRIAAANILASSLMIGASALLLAEGIGTAAFWELLVLVFGLAVGVVFVQVSHDWVESREDVKFAGLSGLDAHTAMLLIFVMAAHSLSEGVGIGVAYASGVDTGHYLTTAIAIHNIPEGLAIALVLVPRGVAVWQAAVWAIITSLPQPLIAVPAFSAAAYLDLLLYMGLGFAAGAMLWMCFVHLLAEALGDSASESTDGLLVDGEFSDVVFELVHTRT